jgi:hypothetical protein
MKRLIIIVASAGLFSACSDARDRRAPVADDYLTRPLEVARVDTTRPLASVEHEITQPPEPDTMPKPRKAKPKKAPPPAAAAPAVDAPPEDTTVKAYAPGSNDMPATDSVPLPVQDSAPTAVDTTVPVSQDTVVPPTSDTLAARRVDSTWTTDSITAAARTIPIGTEIHAALDDSINSRTDSAGRIVTALVMENVTGSDGKTLIPAGAPVRFTVTRLSAAKSKTAQGRLALEVEGIGIGGELRKVSADVRPVPHELRGRGVGTSEAAKVGVGAAGGAVLGRVIGGNTKGAVIGGVVGAAGGAVVASQTASRDVVVKAKTPVVMVLTEPLTAQ